MKMRFGDLVDEEGEGTGPDQGADRDRVAGGSSARGWPRKLSFADPRSPAAEWDSGRMNSL